MRKRSILIFLLVLCQHIMAEPVDHENILKLKYGWNTMVDPYLSPLRYNGQQIEIGNEWWQDFRPRNTYHTENWSHVGKLDIVGLKATSRAKSNYYYGLGAQAGWGAHYGWKWNVGTTKLKIFLGPYLQLNLLAKQHASSVNKPFSVDGGLDVMAMTGLNWTFYAKKTAYRLQYHIRTNLLGMQFVPDYWQSYYEIYEQRLKGNIHFAAPHNRTMLCQQLSMDFQFPHTTWRLGAEHEWLRYVGSDMTWQRYQVCLVVGCIWHYKVERGNW